MKKTLGVACLIGFMTTFAFADDKANQKRPHDRSQRACSTDWSPICARTVKDIVLTYSNQCFADVDGARRIPNYDEGKTCPQFKCDFHYRPVCAFDKTSVQIRAYFNECHAKAQDQDTLILITYAELRDRKIRYKDGRLDINVVCPKECEKEKDLVCAKDSFNNDKRTLYKNRCSAVLEKAVIHKRGLCDD